MKLIVAAMEEEVKAIVDHMDQVRVCSHAGVRLYEGMLEGEACTVMKSGVGKGSCAMTLTIALERLGSVDAVINIGTAGGILDTEEVLDLVISTAVVQHDYDTSPIDGEDGIGLWFEADARLQRAASEAARQLSLRVHHGVVASGDRFISGADEAAALLARFPKAICAEMEAGSVAQVCTHYGIPFIVLRSLSDVAVKAGNAMTFEEYKEAASRRSAALCSSFIKGLHAMH